jgi:hypothetical protein
MKISRILLIIGLVLIAVSLASASVNYPRGDTEESVKKKDGKFVYLLSKIGTWRSRLNPKMTAFFRKISKEQELKEEMEQKQEPYLHEALYAYRRFG